MKNDSPKKRFIGPFDSVIEKILKKELNSRNNPKELEELCSLIFQMLVFNPIRRINYKDLKK